MATGGHVVMVRFSSMPRLAELLPLLDAATWGNARWYLEQWDAKRDPPCCTGCAAVRYLPDAPAVNVTLRTGADLLGAAVASCGELAAFEAGRRRAEAMRAGASTSDAARVAWVVLEERGPNDWHAVVRLADGSRVDPSAEKLAKARVSTREERCGCDG